MEISIASEIASKQTEDECNIKNIKIIDDSIESENGIYTDKALEIFNKYFDLLIKRN